MLKMSRYQLCIGLLFLASINAEDSLQGALTAVHRRQRDLSGYSRYDNFDDYSDLAKYENRKTELEKALYEYLENADELPDELSSSFTSPFRERAGKTKSLYAPTSTRKYRRPQVVNTANEDDYVEFLNEMKYPSEDTSDAVYSTPYKRYNYYNYNSLGYNGVGMRKRRPYSSRPSYNDYDDDLPYSGMYPGGAYGIYKARERRVPFYPVTKRFPVAKRSMKEVPEAKTQGQSVKVKRTDPKVEKELSQLFNNNKKTKDLANGPKEDKSAKKPSDITKKPVEKKITTAIPDEPKDSTEKPLQMSKKSVKWSDYFGIDRRKKSSGMDNEWLINRYHNAVQLAKSKKSENNYEQVPEESTKVQNGGHQHQHNSEMPQKGTNKEESIDELDEKLKGIEESIIDDTLKFTGASGAQDDIGGEEMKDVKDSIISRLATAYNVEKMRKALKEYRQSLTLRHAEDAEEENNGEKKEKEKEKEKRVAVPRKQAIDEDRRDADEDNNIKCTENDENCAEQNYKVPREFMEQATFEKGGCERIERACREVSMILGPYGSIFETACNMHQMCMLCSDNSWFSPTRQCNILFLSKADQLCDGDVGCQRGARESIKYLQHVERNMRADLSIGCNLECPDKR